MNSSQRRRSVLAVGAILLVRCLPLFGQSSGPPPQPLDLLNALQSTLANQPALRIGEEQVVASRGARQRASGIFDTSLAGSFSQNRINNPLTLFNQEQAALLGIITANQVSNVTSLDLGATKEYRNGVEITPSLLSTRTTDNIYNIGGVNLTTLSFQVTVPLLRGRGRDVVAATETAAGIEVQASLLDLNQTISSLLSDTAVSYWNALGAAKGLEVAQRSEARGKIYVDNVQTLITAGRVPEAEINQVNANLATRVGGANRGGAKPARGTPTTGPGDGFEHGPDGERGYAGGRFPGRGRANPGRPQFSFASAVPGFVPPASRRLPGRQAAGN